MADDTRRRVRSMVFASMQVSSPVTSAPRVLKRTHQRDTRGIGADKE